MSTKLAGHCILVYSKQPVGVLGRALERCYKRIRPLSDKKKVLHMTIVLGLSLCFML